MPEDFEFKYKAKIIKVVDGDTFDAEIDLGFNFKAKVRFRMYGLNAPETYGIPKDSEQYKEGLKTKEWLLARLLNKEVILHTFKDKTEKYGRYLASVRIENIDIGEQMIQEGLAERRFY